MVSDVAILGIVLEVAVGLGFVIFVHELGHFVVAKLCGVKCEKFYLGFDMPLESALQTCKARSAWGETEYGIGILPLGGYVKMLGQEDNPASGSRRPSESGCRGRPPASPGIRRVKPWIPAAIRPSRSRNGWPSSPPA